MEGLTRPATERRYWRQAPLNGQVSLVALDVDQAFEARSASKVLPAWVGFAYAFEEHHGPRVFARKGQMADARAGGH
eukprot:7652577-Pyramimonas_sp.AAC.1